MITQLASKLWWRSYLARSSRPWDELKNFPALPPGEQRRILAERLHAQVQYFGNRADALPEWRDAARLRAPEELWRNWSSLPVVTRSMLKSTFEPRQMQARFDLKGRCDSTGGSTGEPTQFFHDPEMIRAGVSANIYSRVQMGWKPGMGTVIVWGGERDIGKSTPFRIEQWNRFARNYVVAGYTLDRATAERALRLIRRHRPVAMYGFTSMLEHVARETLAMHAAPPQGSVCAAWNGGEMLFPQQVEIFRKAFGVTILNRYGGRELSVIACQFREGELMRVMRPWVFLEIVDEQNRPVSPGTPGRVLCTSTICRGTPFLRYEIGDLAAADSSDQDESGIRVLRDLHGRTGSILELAGGKKVGNLFWNHLFKEFSEVHHFQIIVKKDGGLRMLFKGVGFSPEREQELKHVLHNFLGETPFKWEWVDQIPRTRQGKLVQVVRE
ncbi:MAG: AMP-binding protein [Acidobacteria bacterium]|nr:AMP-binding protein [Acidobacteriota bacterium]MCL5289259.1 AMP-binding protein [Acidobacteriota bacterium]